LSRLLSQQTRKRKDLNFYFFSSFFFWIAFIYRNILRYFLFSCFVLFCFV
jgi:hypothetical protein